MLKVLPIVVLCFICGLAHAQSNFEAALIVTHARDTISGLIDNRDWRKNPKLITYKKSETAEAVTFSPLDIGAFHLKNTNEWYRSAILTVDKTSLKESDVIKGINQRGSEIDTVFLRLLVKGKIALYSLVDEFSRTHFIVEKNNLMEELRIEKKRVGSPLAVINLEHFKAQLDAYFADCASVKKLVPRAKYSENSLSELIIQYIRCVNSEQTYAVPRETSELRLSAIAGINYSMLAIAGSNAYIPAGNYRSGIAPFGGLSFEVIFPRNRRSLSINNDLVYRHYSIEERIQAHQEKLFTTIRHRFPSPGMARVFAGAGITNALAQSATDNFRKYEQGLVAETGLAAKKLTCSLRLELTNGFSVFSYTSTKFTNFYASLSYRFK